MFIQPLLWLVIFGAGFGLRFAIPGLKLPASDFSRHHCSNIAFYFNVHGDKRDLG